MRMVLMIGEPYLWYKKRVVRYKPVPPDPDMHNAMCGAKVIHVSKKPIQKT